MVSVSIAATVVPRGRRFTYEDDARVLARCRVNGAICNAKCAPVARQAPPLSSGLERNFESRAALTNCCTSRGFRKNTGCPRPESNQGTRFRKPLLYPLSYGGPAAEYPPFEVA
jgi:hypothetical protein